MNYASSVHYLQEARALLTEGDLEEARFALISSALEVDPVYEAWQLSDPPDLTEDLDLSASGILKKLGVHTKTSVRKDLQKLHTAGQSAIELSDRAHSYNKGASSKDPSDHPDSDVSMGNHHQAIKAHQAMISKLDRAHKDALSAKDHDAAAWISHAKDVHTQHRDWNMKMARNRRFGVGAAPSSPTTATAHSPATAHGFAGTPAMRRPQAPAMRQPQAPARPMSPGAAALASVTGRAPAGHASAAGMTPSPVKKPRKQGLRPGYGAVPQARAVGESAEAEYMSLLESLEG